MLLTNEFICILFISYCQSDTYSQRIFIKVFKNYLNSASSFWALSIDEDENVNFINGFAF